MKVSQPPDSDTKNPAIKQGFEPVTDEPTINEPANKQGGSESPTCKPRKVMVRETCLIVLIYLVIVDHIEKQGSKKSK